MTTLTTNTPADNNTDAAARLWIAEHIASCIAVGLVQTADTGQVNTTTYTRPAINTATAYACFTFNDTMQGTAPIAIKMFFGCSVSTSVPQIRIQVGTAFNGSGVISGVGSANAADIITGSSVPAAATNFVSYYCCVDGFFGFAWKVLATTTSGFFAMARSVSNAQAPNGDAAAQMFGTYNALCSARWASYANGVVYGNAGSSSTPVSNAFWCPIYAGLSSSTLVGGVSQIFKAVMATTPRVRPQLFIAGCLASETALGVQDTATVIGTTPRNYINVGPYLGSGTTGPSGLMMIWE